MTLIIYGQTNCLKCGEVLAKLNNDKVPFEYVNIEDLDELTKRTYVNLAKASGVKTYPIGILDGEIYDLEDYK